MSPDFANLNLIGDRRQHPREAVRKRPDDRQLGRPRALALAGVAGLCAPVAWFSAVDSAGEPLRGSRLLLLAIALCLVALELGGVRMLRFGSTAAGRWLAGASIALLPAALAAGAFAAAVAGAGGPPGDAIMVTLWAIVLFPVLLSIRAAHLHVGAVHAAGPAACAAASAGVAAVILATGLPALAATVPAAVAVSLAAPPLTSADRHALPAGSGVGALLAGATVASWVLAVPPLLAAFAGAVPHVTAAIIVAAGFGVAVGRVLVRGPLRASWAGPAVVALSCLVALALLSEFPVIAQLSLFTGVGSIAPLLPLSALALGAGGTFGLGAALLEPGRVAGRPGHAAAGVLAGALAVTVAGGGGPVDLPLRVAAGIALAGVVAGLLGRGTSVPAPRFQVGWLVAAALTAGLGLLPPLDLSPAALQAASRVPARDIYCLVEIEEAQVLRAGIDRAGPRCVLRTSSGTHLFRGWQAYAPGAAEGASETTLALLPLLAADAPRIAAVVGLGRGETLEPFRAVDVTSLTLLDASPGAARQVSLLSEPLRDLVAHPAVRLERAGARPALPLPAGSQDVVVVDLPRPSLPGARAWYGASLPRELHRALAAGGWASLRVPTTRLTPGDLAATIHASGTAFDDATVWLDPSGNGDVILLGCRDGGQPDVAHIRRGLTRRSLRQARGTGAIRGVEDLLARAFARADAPVFSQQARSLRGLAWRAADAELSALEGVPLSAFADAAQPLDTVVDLDGLDTDDAAQLRAVIGPPEAFWPIYLEFLDRIARGEQGVVKSAERLAASSADPTRDLQPFVLQAMESGRIAEARGQHDDALTWYQLAAAFSPRDVDANVELGRQAWSEDRMPAAIRHFERALERDPDHPVALLGAADAHIRLGETVPALALLEHAAEVHPDSVDAQHNLGRLYLELGRREAALDRFRRALPIEPDNDRIHLGIAEVHFLDALAARDAGDEPTAALQESRRSIQRALTLDESALSLCLYGQIELVAGNYDLAEEALKGSVTLDPDSCDARAALGEVFFAQRRYDAAARQFREAQENCGDDPRIDLRLQQLQHLVDDPEPTP